MSEPSKPIEAAEIIHYLYDRLQTIEKTLREAQTEGTRRVLENRDLQNKIAELQREIEMRKAQTAREG